MNNQSTTPQLATAGQSPALALAPGSASSHREAHLIGKFVTVVYQIEDPTEWRKTNPLQYAHDGLKAIGVSIGDLMERRDELRAALEKIADDTDDTGAWPEEIARAALDKDDSLG